MCSTVSDRWVVHPLCPSFALYFSYFVSFLVLFCPVFKWLMQSQHIYIHILSLPLSLSLPFLSLFCSSRATNNCGLLYLLLYCTILDWYVLVLSTILPSYFPNSYIDHLSIVYHLCSYNPYGIQLMAPLWPWGQMASLLAQQTALCSQAEIVRV